jgi:hypothetical protein
MLSRIFQFILLHAHHKLYWNTIKANGMLTYLRNAADFCSLVWYEHLWELGRSCPYYRLVFPQHFGDVAALSVFLTVTAEQCARSPHCSP